MQPDTNLIRTWEIAGTAHADADYLRSLSVQGKRQFLPSSTSRTVPFSREVRASLYPTTTLRARVAQATKRAVAGKVIVKDAAAELIVEAKATTVGGEYSSGRQRHRAGRLRCPIAQVP